MDLGWHRGNRSRIAYDEVSRAFWLGSTRVLPEHLVQADARGELAWGNESIRAWVYRYAAWAQAQRQPSTPAGATGLPWVAGGIAGAFVLIPLLAVCFALSPVLGGLEFALLLPWAGAVIAGARAEARYRNKVHSLRLQSRPANPGVTGQRTAVLLDSIGRGLVIGLLYFVPAVSVAGGLAGSLGAVVAAVSCFPAGIVTVALSRGWLAVLRGDTIDADLMQGTLRAEVSQRAADRRKRAAERQARERQRHFPPGVSMAQVHAMTGEQFEQFCAGYFRSRGYSVALTPRVADHGIDLVLRKVNEKTLVQCKRHKKPVGEPVVRDLYAVIMHENASRGIVCAASGFTSSAVTWARGKPIQLLSAEQMIR